jgi:tetratricopeptide (TPR) repeat protein
LLPRGLMALGHRGTVEALMRPGAEGRNLARCRALWVAGELSYIMGRYGEATDYVEMSLTIGREIGDRERVAEALRGLGYVVLARGDRAMARGHLQEALALSRQLADTSRSRDLRSCTAQRGNWIRRSRCTRKPWRLAASGEMAGASPSIL